MCMKCFRTKQPVKTVVLPVLILARAILINIVHTLFTNVFDATCATQNTDKNVGHKYGVHILVVHLHFQTIAFSKKIP